MEQIDLSVDYPSACAQKVIDDQADIGIIPTAALLSLPEYYINTDFVSAQKVLSILSLFLPISLLKR